MHKNKDVNRVLEAIYSAAMKRAGERRVALPSCFWSDDGKSASVYAPTRATWVDLPGSWSVTIQEPDPDTRTVSIVVSVWDGHHAGQQITCMTHSGADLESPTRLSAALGFLSDALIAGASTAALLGHGAENTVVAALYAGSNVLTFAALDLLPDRDTPTA